MKTALFFLILFGATACGAASETPKKVIEAFEARYQGAKEVQWTTFQYTFEAEFKHDGFAETALFKKDGTWVSTRTDLSSYPVMKCMSEVIDEEYPYASIIEVEFLETPSKEIYYLTLEMEPEEEYTFASIIGVEFLETSEKETYYLALGTESEEGYDEVRETLNEDSVDIIRIAYDGNCEFLGEL